jgi:hypothetical protein
LCSSLLDGPLVPVAGGDEVGFGLVTFDGLAFENRHGRKGLVIFGSMSPLAMRTGPMEMIAISGKRVVVGA